VHRWRREAAYFMDKTFNILAIGDIVGKPGRHCIRDLLPGIVRQHAVDFIIANAENAAHGMSVTPAVVQELLKYGIDVLTTGNHVWDSREVEEIIDSEPRLLRPANYPDGVRGKGVYVATKGDRRICVINLLGRTHLPPVDCPFRKFDELYARFRNEADIIIVDLHAEATSEKKAFGWYVDGRASAVFGTHTHVQTSDDVVLPRGTGYITDAGMTGAFNSVIGMNKERSIERFLKLTKIKYDVASGDPGINGVIFGIGPDGKAVSAKRIDLRPGK
jgi:2',3'-cyclic-nucleotide 2'-phosphodiesterase